MEKMPSVEATAGCSLEKEGGRTSSNSKKIDMTLNLRLSLGNALGDDRHVQWDAGTPRGEVTRSLIAAGNPHLTARSMVAGSII